MNDSLYAILHQSFRRHGDAPCLSTPEGVDLTYRELENGVDRLCALLRARGVEPGDRVAVQAEKSVGVLQVYLATLKVGAIYLPLNTAYTENEVAYFIDDAQPRLFVQDVGALTREASDFEPDRETAPRRSGDIAALVYTSGTTGRAKGAMLSHGALVSTARALQEAWGLDSDDVLLHALPLFHAHGLFLALNTALLCGSKMIWLDRFDPPLVRQQLRHATVFMGVPTYYTRLLNDPEFGRGDVDTLRLFISGSAPLLPATFTEFASRTGHDILERYAMSEAPIIATNPLEGERVAGSVGFPAPGMRVRIGGSEAIGPIEIAGASLFSGYWRMPERTAAEFTTEGFFVTGDLGSLDADGRLWISGRAKDLVISGGYNVYPREIELLIDAMPGVKESAVIGVPHPDFGEAVVAVVVGTIEPSAVTSALRGQLAGFKIPKKVFLTPKLPRNTMEKIEKASLRREFEKTFLPPA